MVKKKQFQQLRVCTYYCWAPVCCIKGGTWCIIKILMSSITDLSQKCPAQPSWHLHRRMSPPLSQYTAKLVRHFGLIIPEMIANNTNLRQLSSLLVGGNRERTSTGSAGITSKPRGQRITIFTPFAEITCTVVPAILLYGLLQLIGTTTTT